MIEQALDQAGEQRVVVAALDEPALPVVRVGRESAVQVVGFLGDDVAEAAALRPFMPPGQGRGALARAPVRA